MKSISCKSGPALVLFLLMICLLAMPGYAAYKAEDVVGQPGMLLAAVSGYGSLTDESVMGDVCADAIRRAAGTDFALVNGGQHIANLEPKPCTYDDVCAVLAEPEEEIAVAVVTGAELRRMLEAGVSHIVLNGAEAIERETSEFEGFPQISGFSFTYDTSAHPGERVMHIRRDGKELDMDSDERFTIAAPAGLLAGALDYPALPHEGTGIVLAEALADYIAAGTGDAYTGEGRIIAVGCTDYNIVNRFPLVLCVVAAMLIWVGARLWKFKYFDRNTR
ncbi:MAG: 5'-nucleotidase C-terminal domain-containing protein [Oscillospiraceae bacterium]